MACVNVMQIKRQLSTALDAVRFVAALTVFLHHANWLGLDGGMLSWFRRDVGHSAVVIFFVLSGYVISASSTRDTGLTFAIKRASRILTVAVPALVLTLVLDLSARAYALPVPLQDYELQRPLLYLGFALTFAGDFWSLAIPVFSNNPFWSLNYEVWYYAVFGIAVFARGPWRVAGLVGVMALIGPKLWVLFPIWLAGVALQRWGDRWPLKPPTARMLAVAALAAFLALKALHVEDMLNGDASLGGLLPMRFSQWFLGDYLVTIPVVALIHGLAYAELRFTPALERIVVAGAGISFSLYLVHFPLLSFFGALLPAAVAVPLAFAISVAVGAVFEPQRHALRRLLTASFVRRQVPLG